MYQFLTKDESLTTQASSMNIGQTRKGATSNSFNCGTSPVLRERNTSFTCKGTQTDCDVPGSAGTWDKCYFFVNIIISILLL